jgi:RecA-family ATPase
MEIKTPKRIDLSKAIDKAVNSVAIERTVNSTDDNHGLFLIKTANKWIEEAKSRPIPKMLFSQLWYEGELCILFADTNLGKSILAVQIGNSISKGEQIKNFDIQTQKQPVLYFDFELSDKQFQNRYSKDYTDNYAFDDNFLRVEINPDLELSKDVTFDDFLILSIEKSILSSNAKVLIIDNLTYRYRRFNRTR